MRGFSLLEFVIATTFLCIIFLTGFQVLEAQKLLSTQITGRTQSEEESNYRAMVLKNFFHEVAAAFHRDSLLSKMPFCFPDLNFGLSPSQNSLSIAVPKSASIPFVYDGSKLKISSAFPVQPDQTMALAGSCADQYCWNYAKVTGIVLNGSVQELTIQPFLNEPVPEGGSLLLVELNGFAFQKDTLFWISPAGANEPFWAPLDDFRFDWSGSQVHFYWHAGSNDGDLVVQP
jgi:hypothetical protein